MHIAHRDKFLFTDLSRQMGIRENHFNWLAVNMPTAHALSRGYREEAWNYYEFGGDCE